MTLSCLAPFALFFVVSSWVFCLVSSCGDFPTFFSVSLHSKSHSHSHHPHVYPVPTRWKSSCSFSIVVVVGGELCWWIFILHFYHYTSEKWKGWSSQNIFFLRGLKVVRWMSGSQHETLKLKRWANWKLFIILYSPFVFCSLCARWCKMWMGKNTHNGDDNGKWRKLLMVKSSFLYSTTQVIQK